MRPIRAPDYPVGRCFDDRLRERDHVQVRQASLDMSLRDRTDLVEAAKLHPESVILEQVEKKPEGRLGETVLAAHACHVVDDRHRRKRPDEPLMFDEIRRIDMENENPVKFLQGGKMLGQMLLIAGPILHQMKAGPAYPSLGQTLKRLAI